MKLQYGLIAAATALTVSTSAQSKINYVEYDLSNGLHVILHEDHSTPIVGVTVMYHVGSKNEDPTRTGMAHFFEHLLFEGSENIERGEFDKYIENAGGTLNANTSNDRTFYYEVLPSNQLELGLWLESERMLHAKVEQVGVETQREVVKEEKRQRMDNQPYGSVLAEVFKRMYTVHPYKWTTIGSMEHLNQTSLEEFMEFYKTFYVPNNAVLSIGGDINIAQTKKLIAKYFGTIPKGVKDIPRPTVVEPALGGEVRDTVFDNVQLPGVIQAYRIPAQGTPDFYAVDMLATLLSGGESSRFHKRVVDQDQLAVAAFAFPFPLEHPGVTLSYMICNAGVDPSKAEAALNEEIVKVQEELITERELTKLKNQVENQFASGNSRVVGVAESLANYHMYFGEANLINSEIDRYMKVTADDIKRVAKTYFTPENRVVLYYLPKSEEK
ncbi:MAG: zinc protease [Luteibaculaceae bacterium]|jgi:zinc protease